MRPPATAPQDTRHRGVRWGMAACFARRVVHLATQGTDMDTLSRARPPLKGPRPAARLLPTERLHAGSDVPEAAAPPRAP